MWAALARGARGRLRPVRLRLARGAAVAVDFAAAGAAVLGTPHAHALLHATKALSPGLLVGLSDSTSWRYSRRVSGALPFMVSVMSRVAELSLTYKHV